jgi:hypothetical protein
MIYLRSNSKHINQIKINEYITKTNKKNEEVGTEIALIMSARTKKTPLSRHENSVLVKMPSSLTNPHVVIYRAFKETI